MSLVSKLDPKITALLVIDLQNDFCSPFGLMKELSEKAIKTLIITGVSTQICVETAIRNGFDLGYKIVVPRDLVATTSKDPDIQNRTLRLVEKTYGVVVTSPEIITILRAKKHR